MYLLLTALYGTPQRLSPLFFIEHYISVQSRKATNQLCCNAMGSIKVLLSFILDLCKIINFPEMLVDQTDRCREGKGKS